MIDRVAEDQTPPDEAVKTPVEPELLPTPAGEQDASEPMVTEPLKLVRIASMVQAMLMEVRAIELDDNATSRLRNVHSRTVNSLKEIISDDLKDELAHMVLPLKEGATEAEARLAQAQLSGWLEGLFHGIRASLWGQQIAVQRAASQNLEALHALEAKEEGKPDGGSTGLYL